MIQREPDPEDFLRTIQTVLHMQTPLNFGAGEYSAFDSLQAQMLKNSTFALDVLDLLVRVTGRESAEDLEQTLALGNSVWRVSGDEQGHRELVRATTGPIAESIDSIRMPSQRAHAYLMRAWSDLSGRKPNPSGAYGNAIKAVEVVARPVVSPKDKDATLGKMITALREGSSKWEVVLDKSSPQQIADMASLIWRGQQDRHGNDDPSAALNVSQEEADAAVHIAIALVRIFAAGLIRPASSS